jgi:hypothetical protein
MAGIFRPQARSRKFPNDATCRNIGIRHVDPGRNAGWGRTNGEDIMAQTESRSNGMEKSSLSNLAPTGLAAMGEKRMEEFAKVQAVIFSTLHETHQRWLGRMQSEARLASEFTERMTSARSIPDAMTACREWTSQRLEMMADEGNHLLAESRKVMETGVRFLSDGSFIMNEQAVVAEAGKDPATGDRQRLHTHDQNNTGPAIVSSQRAAMHAGSFEESRPDGDAASL